MPLQWSVGEPNGNILTLVGELDEITDLAPAKDKLRGRDIDIDLGGVRRVSSVGLRAWINFIDELSRERNVRLLRCSVQLTEQFSLATRARGRAAVVSVMLPYRCRKCSAQTQAEYLLRPQPPTSLPNRACTQCEGIAEFDHLIDAYFAFMDLN